MVRADSFSKCGGPLVVQMTAALIGSLTGAIVRALASHQGKRGLIPSGPLSDFHMWELCWSMLLVIWFSQGSPVSLALAFWCCSKSTSLHPHQLSRPSCRVDKRSLSVLEEILVSVLVDNVLSCRHTFANEGVMKDVMCVERRTVVISPEVKNASSVAVIRYCRRKPVCAITVVGLMLVEFASVRYSSLYCQLEAVNKYLKQLEGGKKDKVDLFIPSYCEQTGQPIAVTLSLAILIWFATLEWMKYNHKVEVT
ncbi:hypothetical protein PR048_024609 [Dryococelus australis]|uniref:Uncharacterized protein n=1 Tax=Dryococelus australis TaxID=614101 RepID=A0ABQ9GP27_9NEOP|nr:hypothetical protein PR048_024609 [Dryococelus australis]